MSVCRLCLNNTDEEMAISIFDHDLNHGGNVTLQLSRIIMKYLHLEIYNDDTISTSICKECHKHLQEFHQYCLRVEEKQDTLRNEFFDMKTDIPILSEDDIIGEQDEMLLDMKYIPQIEHDTASSPSLSPVRSSQQQNSLESENNEKKPTTRSSASVLRAKKYAPKSREQNSFKRGNDEKKTRTNLSTTVLRVKRPALTSQQKNSLESVNTLKKPRIRSSLPVYRVKPLEDEDNNDSDCGCKDDDWNPCDADNDTYHLKEQKLKRKHSKKDGSVKESIRIRAPRKSNKEKSRRIKNETLLEIIANVTNLNCDLCKSIVNNYSELCDHFEKEHKCVAYVKCCEQVYRDRESYGEHMKFHQEENLFKCNICNQRFRTKRLLVEHKTEIHDAKDHPPSYVCNICGKDFLGPKWLETHISKHETGDRYPCEICNKSFVSPSSLKRHIDFIHENIYPYVCDVCGKEYRFKPSFQKHLRQHQGIIDPPMQCKLCGEWTKNKNSLRLHVMKHYDGGAKCTICGRMSPSKNALRRHMCYVHELQKQLKCNYCDKTFKVREALEEHVATHTGAQLYSCPHCPKEWRSRSNMYAHIKRQHYDEWIQSKRARSNDPKFKAETK